MFIVAAFLYARAAGGIVIFGLPAAVWLSGAGTIGCFVTAWRRRR